MATHRTRITSKGQLVVPKHLRDRKHLRIGDSVRIEDRTEVVRIVRRSGWAQATAGCLATSLPQMEPEDLEEMAERAALQEAREEWGAVD